MISDFSTGNENLFPPNKAVVGFYVWLSVNDIPGFIRIMVARIKVVLYTIL